MLRIFIYIAVLSINTDVIAQLPTTDMYILDINFESDQYEVGECKFFSSFNIGGYNNQPYFMSSDNVLITSNKDNKKSTDIYQLNLTSKTISRLINNDLSEYSPSIRPHSNQISVVSVEHDGSQVLRAFDASGDELGESYNLLPSLRKIAYYDWIDNHRIAISMLDRLDGETMNLYVANIEEKTKKKLVEDVGRCIRTTDKRNGFYFVHKLTPEFWYLKYYNLQADNVTIIVQMLNGIEDFELMNDGTIIIAKEDELFKFSSDIDHDWVSIANLASYGLTNMKRIAINGNKMIICNVKEK